MDVSARMFPLKSELVPSVAELPTCQKTLQAVAPLARATWLPLPGGSVDPIWKMNTAPGLPAPSRVTSADIASHEVDWQRQGVSFRPTRSPDTEDAPARPAASIFPAVNAACACAAAPSAMWIVPLASPGGNPVTA